VTLKTLLKGLTPPLLLPLFRRFRDLALHRPRQAKWEYSPTGWIQSEDSPWNTPLVEHQHRRLWDAWVAAASGPGPLGVDYFRSLRGFDGLGEDAVDRELAWAHNGVMAYAYVLALTARHKERLSILDWGGGVGQFEQIAAALLPDVELEYHSRDVPVLSALGAQLNPAVTFHSDDESWSGRSYDLVTSISAFQFEQDWQSLFANLASVTGQHLFVSRLPIVLEAPSFVVVQRAAAHQLAFEFCGWFLNRDELLERASRCGLLLRREFLIMDETPADGVPEQARYRGFLFARADES
jgi:putative methyltransferase (TIGR04325 family)